MHVHEICRLVFHEDKRNKNLSFTIYSWVKLWTADSYWPLPTEENIFQKYFLRPTFCDYTEKWLLLKWYEQLAFIAISEEDVGEKEAHSLGGGCLWGFWPNHTISEPHHLPGKDSLCPTELSCDHINKNG